MAGVPATKIAKFREKAAVATKIELKKPVAPKGIVTDDKKARADDGIIKKFNKYRKQARKLGEKLCERYVEEIARKAESEKLIKKAIEELVKEFEKLEDKENKINLK